MIRNLGIVMIVVLVLFPCMPAGGKEFPFLTGAGKKSIILRWASKEKELPSRGFNIYRKIEGAKTWTRLNPKPLTRITDKKVLREKLGDELFKAVFRLMQPGPMEFEGEQKRSVEDETRRSLLLLYADFSPKVAEALGLRWDDTTVEPGKSYLYRLASIDENGNEKVLAASSKPIGLQDYTPLDPPPVFRAEAGDGTVSFTWIKEARFSAYNLYRSAREKGAYKKINIAPIIVLFTTDESGRQKAPEYLFEDSDVVNSKTYWYCVRGVDAFGRESEESKRISATPVDLTPPLAPQALRTKVEGDRVVVSWKRSPEKDALGYHMYRGISYQGPFKRITDVYIPLYATAYEDKGLKLGASYWYYATAIDTSGNESGPSYTVLAKVIDRVPPHSPEALEAQTEPGRVTLNWRANTEADMAGYRVYRSMDKTAEHYHMINQEPFEEAYLVHELPEQASDKPFFFKVSAIDTSGNESDFSQIIEVQLPDVTPPDVPVFKDYHVEEGSVELSWYPNIEDDLAGYYIYRKAVEEQGRSATKLNREILTPDILSYTDQSDLIPGIQYAYTLRAMDTSNNLSISSRAMVASTFDTTPPRPPQEVRAELGAEEKAILVHWSMPPDTDLKGVVVYRSSSEKGPFLPITHLVTKPGHTDEKVYEGREYFYQVVAFDRSNNRSKAGGPVRIRFETKPGE